MYDFRRASKGTLGYVVGQVRDVNMFTEWDYTTSDGVTLHLANSESDNKSDRASFILLDSDDAFYVMSFAHEGYADYLGDGRIDGIGDGFVEFNISNAQLEKLAESFDWLALFDPERGMDGDFRTYSSPNNAASPADTVSLSSEPDFGNVSEEDLYFVKLAYRESIEPCISGFRLIDYCLTGGMNGRDGWVQFSGTPRTKLDWSCTSANGSNVYCRSLNMLSDGRGSWTMGTAYDALPYKPLSNYENIGTEENPDYVYVGCDLSGISSAELYVQQTGRSYTLSADKLSTLELMLRDDGTPGTVSNCNTFNPLWLTLSDGRSLAETLNATLQARRPDAVVAFEPSALEQAAQLAQGQEKPPLVYGTGATGTIASYLERSSITLSAAQNEFAAGYLAVEAAVRSARGQDQAAIAPLDFSLIRQENMYDPDNQKLLFPVTR